MPKEADDPECGDDSKEMAAASAESGKRKVLTNTPSTTREEAQASSTTVVTMEELMEAAKGVTNMTLAHEIMVNQAFKVKPLELPEDSLEFRVKDIMHKAFWDCLEAQLQETPPIYEHAIKLLAEIKETLLSLLLRSQGRLRSHIEEVLDLPLLHQQASNGALDISQLSHFIIEMMGMLCAPCRDEDIRKLKEIPEMIPLLKRIFSVLDMMKIDMANFALSSIRPHLMQQSVEYERSKFQDFLEKQPNALDYTEKWLNSSMRSLRKAREISSSAASYSSDTLSALDVHNYAYLLLLRWDHPSDPFPETVLMDQVRFQEMQREAEQLVWLSSVLLIVHTSTGGAISGLPGFIEALKNTINAIFANINTQSFGIPEALATIGERLCFDLSQWLSGHGYPLLTAEQQSSLRGQISAIIQPDNTVHKLIDSRVQSYLLASLESGLHTAPKLPGGLTPVSKELRELAIRFVRLVNFNKLVFSPFYQKILHKILTTGEIPSTNT